MKSTSESKRLLFDERPAGELRISRLSKWTLWWIVRTLKTGYRRPLLPKDIYDIQPEYSAETNAAYLKHLEEFGKSHHRRNGHVIILHILRSFPCKAAQLASLFLLWGFVSWTQALFLGLLLDYIDCNNVSDAVGYTYAALLVLSAFGFVFLNAVGYCESGTFATTIRSAYSNLIYKKILELRVDRFQATTAGHIINLLSTDVECVYQNIECIFVGFGGHLNMQLSIFMLCYNMGWSSTVGLGVCFTFLLVSSILHWKSAHMRSTIAKATDYRVKTMNEIISAIRVIKLYCWEKFFQATITDARRKEIHKIMVSDILRGIGFGVIISSGMLAAASVLVIYHETGHQLTASNVFTTLLYCQMIETAGPYSFPFQKLGQAVKSLERIEEFLLVEDDGGSSRKRRDERQDDDLILPNSAAASIELEKASAWWECSMETQVYHLRNLTFSCEQGTLLAVSGSVGAGKTSLLMLLAKEMPRREGRVHTRGKLSYCSQDPWIFHGTVRENILFGQEMNYQRYREVLSVCALSEDLSAMVDGDVTLIGENGLTLSGGQKARISLARAVYRDADIYLLDDPLSAVDIKVGSQLFERCVKSYLDGKTRVLVTHQAQHLPYCDKVVFLEKGEVEFVGKYHDLSGNTANKVGCQIKDCEKRDDGFLPKATNGGASLDENTDEIAEGTVQWSVYLKYIQAGGVRLFIFSVTFFVISECLRGISNWYLSKWTEFVKDRSSNSTQTKSEVQVKHVFIAMAVTSTMLRLVVEVPLWVFLALAGKRLHDTMFYRVMRAPTSFYDINPIGNVLNRFSRDMGFVDLFLPITFRRFIRFVTTTLSQLVLACAVLPWLFLLTAAAFVLLYQIYWFSMRGIRQLKRLEARSRSPVYSHVSDTLRGLQTIRIMERENDFLQNFNNFQDDHTMRWLMYLVATRWLALVISSVFVALFALAVISSLVLKDALSAPVIGLCIFYLLTLLESFEFSFRSAADLETFITSVERIISYSRLEEEPVCDNKPPDGWPEAGRIRLENMSLYYYEGAPAALHDISVDINPGERVGIIGRTGSGKSSILQSLVRLTEPLGDIYIDGVNTKSIGLQDLREKISVIPQDPVLFGGTLRRNLDPQSLSDENDLWDALCKVQLTERFKSMSGGLDTEILSRGSNLSTGERQLVCLARALLKTSRIIVVDEATANIDKKTDQIIHDIIRANFQGCTVLIIAHRLDTIMDCNKVMVLDQGKLVECDMPYKLLQNQDGIFRSFVQQTGPEHATTLYEIAEKAFINRIRV